MKAFNKDYNAYINDDSLCDTWLEYFKEMQGYIYAGYIHAPCTDNKLFANDRFPYPTKS